MTRIDLYPNPAFVEAVRKDGYKEYSSDVFDRSDKPSKFYFIREAIKLTDFGISKLKSIELEQVDNYNRYYNTIKYLINYYEFLLEENKKNILNIGATYTHGFYINYMKAVNSKKSILYSIDGEVDPLPPKKWSEKMDSWFPVKLAKKLIYSSPNYAPVLQIKGPNAQGSSYFNLILVSSERNKGFEYNSQKMFMNWNGNPLNNKTD